MTSGDNPGPERDVREKISSQMRAIGHTPGKPISSEELQKLKNAANRLDQLLKTNGDADQQKLRDAAARLDQLLSDIRAGKDVDIRKRKQNTRNTDG